MKYPYLRVGLAIFACLLPVCSCADVECQTDKGWNRFSEDSCYLTQTRQEMTWYDARDWCRAQGADLASIHSEEERHFWLLPYNTTGGSFDVWIGLHRPKGKNHYEWSDGTRITFRKWAPGNPERTTDCVYQSTKHGVWMSADCRLRKGFTCKKHLERTNREHFRMVAVNDPIPGYCPGGYFEIGDKCLKIVEKNKDNGAYWSKALEICRAGPGSMPDLASIHSAEENAHIAARLFDHAHGYWIGLHKNSSVWVWSDSSKLDFTYWAPSEPGFYDDGAYVSTYPAPLGMWAGEEVSEKLGYICQTFKDASSVIPTPQSTTPHQCAPGYTPYWYSCYRLETTPRTQQDAENRCQNDGGHLVSIHTETENAAVLLLAGQSFPLWIGFIQEEDGIYNWTDNWPVSYTNWDWIDDEMRCVAMKTTATWTSVDCQSSYASLCKTTLQPRPTTPPDTPGSCPSEWEAFGSHCYRSYGSSVSWESAYWNCREEGADLVSIHSYPENHFVYELWLKQSSYYEPWTGLYKRDRDAPFEWTDDSVVDYFRWAPGEPNSVDGSELCVEMYTEAWPGLWNDQMCSMNRGYVCKMTKDSIPISPSMPSMVPSLECPVSPRNWTGIREDCFWFEPDEWLQQDDAEKVCQKYGGSDAHLTSINSEADNLLIMSGLIYHGNLPLDRKAWIGLSRKAFGEDWSWSDGSTYQYSNWASELSPSPESLCVEMNLDTGEWWPAICHEQFHGFVCKLHVTEPKPDGLSTAEILAIVFGILGALALIFCAAVFVIRARSTGSQAGEVENDPNATQMAQNTSNINPTFSVTEEGNPSVYAKAYDESVIEVATEDKPNNEYQPGVGNVYDNIVEDLNSC